jgi:uncharacterized protein YqgC (DUF456 family)
MDAATLAYVVAAVLVLVGLAGIILPALPGTPLVFAGMLIAAWADDFHKVPIWVVVILGVLTAISVAVDFFASSLGAQKAGASKYAVWGAAIGTIAGLFLGFIGLILGPFVGAVLGELLAGREFRHASKVGFATWIGLVIGAALKLALAFGMVGIFALAWFV